VAGYQQAPTLVNNVETLVAVACLMASDLRQVCTVGTPDSPGTKLISVSGDCRRPGVYEYEFGVSLERILSDCGADDAQAVQVAGPAGHLIPASQFQRRIAFEDLPTGGSFMVFHRDRDLMQVMLNFAAFFRHESCGFCTPCRVGTTLVEQLLEKFQRRQAGGADLQHLQRIARSMCVSSHCGLGQTAANAVLDSLARIPEVYRNRLAEGGLAPAFDLDEALEEARACTGRRDAAAHLRFPDAGGNDPRRLS
jgi:[NiFe] hydrogenase diaphorase moiety large subunit